MDSKKAGIEKAKNFMRQYRDPESRELKKLSANQFMEVWSHYDQDGELSQAAAELCVIISCVSFVSLLSLRSFVITRNFLIFRSLRFLLWVFLMTIKRCET